MSRDWFGNIAVTLDNKLGFVGKQTRISNTSDFEIVHYLRNELSGIAVGSNTILVDNPTLLTRKEYLNQNRITHPIPILFDRRARIPLTHEIFSNKFKRSVIWITAKPQKLQHPHIINLVQNNLQEAQKKINEELDKLNRIGPVMIEGGSTFMIECIRKGIIDKLRIFTSSTSISNSDIELLFDDEREYRLISVDEYNSGFERIYHIC